MYTKKVNPDCSVHNDAYDDYDVFQDTIDTLKREVAESRARLHAHSEIERTLRAQLEAARAEIERANTVCNTSCNSPCNAPCNKSDAACDPVCCEVEECELRLRANEELSTDANELAAEVFRISITILFNELRFHNIIKSILLRFFA